MKYNRKNELDVDFIGGERPLTKEEEKMINDYINAKKASAGKANTVARKRVVKRKKSVA